MFLVGESLLVGQWKFKWVKSFVTMFNLNSIGPNLLWWSSIKLDGMESTVIVGLTRIWHGSVGTESNVTRLNSGSIRLNLLRIGFNSIGSNLLAIGLN